jgi:hypothetical protein
MTYEKEPQPLEHSPPRQLPPNGAVEQGAPVGTNKEKWIAFEVHRGEWDVYEGGRGGYSVIGSRYVSKECAQTLESKHNASIDRILESVTPAAQKASEETKSSPASPTVTVPEMELSDDAIDYIIGSSRMNIPGALKK